MPRPTLLFSNTVNSADLYAVVPLTIMDSFLYAEIGDRKVAVVDTRERDRVLGLNMGIEVIDPIELGLEELRVQGDLSHAEIDAKVAAAACQKIGVSEADVPAAFPLIVADEIRASGIKLTINPDRFSDRRRSKSPQQIEGIRQAQKAADASMAKAAELLRNPAPALTSEQIRKAMQQICSEMNASMGDDVIVAVNAQSANVHEGGYGPIAAGDIVLIDIWPMDKKSGCYADMTRTFIAAGAKAPEELEKYWRLCRESIETVMPMLVPGANCGEIFAASCEPFHRAGEKTQLNKQPGVPLDHGFFHSLGHGVGLEVHEAPSLGRGSSNELRVGDVVTVEPGCYRPGFGGVRLEDLILITDSGPELLTDYPYDLTP